MNDQSINKLQVPDSGLGSGNDSVASKDKLGGRETASMV